jgi:hypothetical protein
MARTHVVVGLLALGIACQAPGPEPAEPAVAGGDSETGEFADDGCPNDMFESNEHATDASAITWDDVSSEGELHDARVTLDGYLCPGEHDWYAIPIAELGFDDHVLRVDGLVAGASWCGQIEGCGGAALSSAPENTIAVEVYDAASVVLLAADIATDGRVDIDASGANFGKDLIVHVYSPTAAATFAYELHVDLRSYDGEVDCEC